MSSVCFQLIFLLCLLCPPLSNAGCRGVVWKEPGEDVTIQCRTQSKPENLHLKKALNQDIEMYFITEKENRPAKKFENRLEFNGQFPDIDILIKNLTAADTALYWCEYRGLNTEDFSSTTTKGNCSVLLVVRADAVLTCDPSQHDLLLVSLTISASVLILIIMVFLIWMIHKRKSKRTLEQIRVASNGVYEDMRATLRG